VTVKESWYDDMGRKKDWAMQSFVHIVFHSPIIQNMNTKVSYKETLI